MKKFLFATMALIFMALAFAGCSNDDESSDALNGTTWMYSGSYATQAITFAGTTFKGKITLKNQNITSEVEGTYVYYPPTIHITFFDPDEDKKVTSSGVVEGNKMTFVDEEGDVLTYTKQ